MDYSKIKNPKLRELAAASKSIKSMPADQAEQMLREIAKIPPEGEAELIQAFENEQVKLAEIAEASQPSREDMVASIDKLKQIKKKFTGDVLKEHESADAAITAQEATDLLKKLDE